MLILVIDDEDTFCQLEVLKQLLRSSQVTHARYPKLSRLVLEIDLEVDWDGDLDDSGEWLPVVQKLGKCAPNVRAFDAWIPSVPTYDTEEVDEELDAALVSVVQHTAVPAITVQWAESQTYVGPECEACIRSMFPVLSANGMLVFHAKD